MTTGDVVYSLRFSLIKILPEPGFDLGSTAGESCVLTARLHMLCVQLEIIRLDEITLQRQNLVENSPNHVKYAHILDFKIFDDLEMHDANEIECLIF